MRLNDTRILSVLIISFSLINSGCSVIGFGLGALDDSSRPDMEIVNPDDYNNIKILSEIIIYQKDRSTKKGKLIEFTEEYLALETTFGLENVNRDEIFNIEVKSNKNGKWIGLGVGFVMDIYLLATFIAPQGEG